MKKKIITIGIELLVLAILATIIIFRGNTTQKIVVAKSRNIIEVDDYKKAGGVKINIFVLYF